MSQPPRFVPYSDTMSPRAFLIRVASTLRKSFGSYAVAGTTGPLSVPPSWTGTIDVSGAATASTGSGLASVRASSVGWGVPESRSTEGPPPIGPAPPVPAPLVVEVPPAPPVEDVGPPADD